MTLAEDTCDTCAMNENARCSLAGLPLADIDRTLLCPHWEARPICPACWQFVESRGCTKGLPATRISCSEFAERVR